MADAIRLRGMRQLQRAFRAADKAVAEDLRDALAEAAAPVRSDAQMLAGSRIRRLHHGDPWTGMRIGVTQSLVYVAPVERGVKSRGGRQTRGRPNLADLLMGRAMEPALARNRPAVEARLDRAVDDICDVWERG